MFKGLCIRVLHNYKITFIGHSCQKKINLVQYSGMAVTVVETKQGKLKGVVRDNIDGGKYISFRGVPFAEPPVGPLRFRVSNKVSKTLM